MSQGFILCRSPVTAASHRPPPPPPPHPTSPQVITARELTAVLGARAWAAQGAHGHGGIPRLAFLSRPHSPERTERAGHCPVGHRWPSSLHLLVLWGLEKLHTPQSAATSRGIPELFQPNYPTSLQRQSGEGCVGLGVEPPGLFQRMHLTPVPGVAMASAERVA